MIQLRNVRGEWNWVRVTIVCPVCISLSNLFLFESSLKSLRRAALVAVWSEALSLTTHGLESEPGANEKVTSDKGLGGGFRWVLRFPPTVTTG